jgi:flagellar motor protein MotB
MQRAVAAGTSAHSPACRRPRNTSGIFSISGTAARDRSVRSRQPTGVLVREPGQRAVAVEGFIGNLGFESLNQELSERRALTIRNALIAAGVAGDRIAVHSYGKAYPIASNGDAKGRQVDRRVEVVISDQDGRIRLEGA